MEIILGKRAVVTAAVLVLTACGHGNLLHQYDFRASTLGVVSDVPWEPDVLSGSWFDLDSSGDPVRDIMRVGARVVREVSAADLETRLDSASTLVDVGYVMEYETLQRAARYLGSDPVPPETTPDYLLELIVLEYGVVADAWDAPAQFFIEAEATLLHEDTGTEIWRAKVGARDPVGPAIWGGPQEVRDVVTATVLATLEVEEIAALLEGLADFSARVVTDRLRNDLREARRR